MQLNKRILFEDNHLIVVNKLPGELVQGDSTGDKPLLEKVRDYIREEYNKPGNVYCGLIHRLDRPTSGIVAFAKTSKALSRMNAIFEKREVEKKYYAITRIKPPQSQAHLKHFLKKDQQKNKSFPASATTKGAKEARLDYRLIAESERYFLLEVLLHTGRHHQIRAQLAQEGMPIKGDLKYGFPRSNPDASISLHAGKLKFTHPIGPATTVEINAPCLADDKLWTIFNEYIA